MTHHSNVPSGWYDDGTGTGAQRWWDGQRWTEHRTPPRHRPASYAGGPAAPGPVRPSWPSLGYDAAGSPARARSRQVLPLALVAVMIVGAFVLYSFIAGGGGHTEWYDEGYAAGRDGAVSLFYISGNAESACNMALIEKIKFDDSSRSRRVKDLRRGCLQAVKDSAEK